LLFLLSYKFCNVGLSNGKACTFSLGWSNPLPGVGTLNLVIAFIVGVSLSAGAEEGFRTLGDGFPHSALAAENAVVMVKGRYHTATAVLVRVYEKNNKRTGLFVTNAHVLEHCYRNLSEDCSNEQILHHETINGLGLQICLSEDNDCWSNSISKVVAYDPRLDLAAFTVSNLSEHVQPASLREWSSMRSKAVIAIGNPYLNSRQGWRKPFAPGVSLNDKFYKTLWSEGQFVKTAVRKQAIIGERPKRDPETHDLLTHFTFVQTIYHTSDIIPGCSGGPLIDSDGYVIGINSSVSTDKKGHVGPYSKSLNGLAIPASVVENFIATIK